MLYPIQLVNESHLTANPKKLERWLVLSHLGRDADRGIPEVYVTCPGPPKTAEGKGDQPCLEFALEMPPRGNPPITGIVGLSVTLDEGQSHTALPRACTPSPHNLVILDTYMHLGFMLCSLVRFKLLEWGNSSPSANICRLTICWEKSLYSPSVNKDACWCCPWKIEALLLWGISLKNLKVLPTHPSLLLSPQ